jgi:hypothetical protein
MMNKYRKLPSLDQKCYKLQKEKKLNKNKINKRLTFKKPFNKLIL